MKYKTMAEFIKEDSEGLQGKSLYIRHMCKELSGTENDFFALGKLESVALRKSMLSGAENRLAFTTDNFYEESQTEIVYETGVSKEALVISELQSNSFACTPLFCVDENGVGIFDSEDDYCEYTGLAHDFRLSVLTDMPDSREVAGNLFPELVEEFCDDAIVSLLTHKTGEAFVKESVFDFYTCDLVQTDDNVTELVITGIDASGNTLSERINLRNCSVSLQGLTEPFYAGFDSSSNKFYVSDF